MTRARDRVQGSIFKERESIATGMHYPRSFCFVKIKK
jgi:hypothetical protein